ncbi:hypothetical protein ACFP63_00700 [Oerskovia jenensis]|uniref:hypothetical protein n=1 Tax=Oerskovia jenensis TaxID=162169 RepID=UPI0019634E2C|nr:hypothetical protein [Oerskovia jenensis]
MFSKMALNAIQSQTRATSIPLLTAAAAITIGMLVGAAVDPPKLTTWVPLLALTPLVIASLLGARGWRVGAIRGLRQTLLVLALVAIVLFLGGRILMYFIRPELAFALLLVLLAIVSSNRRLFASSLILLGYGAVTTVLSYISAIDDSRLVMLALDLGSIALFWYLGAKELKRERSNDK